ncbi:efflux RND transporter permease subunit [Parvibaculaceae bacterium PLY_AMNH_Bact1]|nr:efflux RND transporter permease subunit [Parvibaculaceae bacterium PLY_AMNH_Bact1]
MGNIAAYAIRNGRFTLFALIALAATGIAIYFSHPSQEDPEVTIRTAVVTAYFPGMSAERIEQLIVKPIEETAKQISEVTDMTSTASTGAAMVKVEVGDKYFDLDPIWTDLRNKMNDLTPSLPSGTSGPYVNDDFGRVAVATLALTGADYSMAELRQVARDLRDAIGALPLVSQVDLYGIQDEQIWLTADQTYMDQLGLSQQAVIAALTGQNVILPGGSIAANGQRITIEPSGSFTSVDEIRDLPLELPEGGIVYIRDIFDVERGYVDPPSRPTQFNGVPSLMLGVAMVNGSNIAEFGVALEALLADLEEDLPLGMALEFATYQPPLVAAAVSDATNNLLQTIATVLVVVILFLGVRTGLIVGSIVPLAILAALVGMSLWEIPLHRISIAAIIIALGLLVDNGIVIAEDIKRRMEDGVDRLEACVGAPRELGMPLLSSSLTTILAFMPLYLAEDVTGEYVGALAQVLFLALIASWFLSIAITPTLCFWLLDGDLKRGEGTDVYDSAPYRFYRQILSFILAQRLLFIAAMVGLLVVAILGMGFVTSRLMPPSDRAQFVVHIELPTGADVNETIRVTDGFLAWLSDKEINPDVVQHAAYIADGGPRFFLAMSPVDPVPHKAFVLIDVTALDVVGPMMAKSSAYFRDEVPEAQGRPETLFFGATPPGTVDIQITGPEIAQLYLLGHEVEEVFRSVPGSANIRTNWGSPVVKVLVQIDQERARRAGVSSEDVANSLASYFDGLPVTDFRDGDTVIPIKMRAAEDQRDELDKLRSITVYSSASNVAVPLIQIADIDGVLEPFEIHRFNQERGLKASAILPGRQASEFYAALQPALGAIELPRGYAIEVQGELKDSGEATGALFAYLPHCAAAILVLLVWQFNSYRRPAVILLTIPLIMIGATSGLLLTGAFLDFNAMLGLLSLGGIIINNGIVMIERIDLDRAAGKSVHDAVVSSALVRARPIIMTTLTTILGLMPLMLFGGELWFAMTIVIMFGLAAGTVLTLGVVPVLYSLFFDFARSDEGGSPASVAA